MMSLEAQQIVETLQSIKRVSLQPEGVEMVKQSGEVFTKAEFLPGSFTRDLLELIESHLLDG